MRSTSKSNNNNNNNNNNLFKESSRFLTRESSWISKETWIKIKISISKIQIFSKGRVHQTLTTTTTTTTTIIIIIILSKDSWDRSSTRENPPEFREVWIKIKIIISEIQKFFDGVYQTLTTTTTITTIIIIPSKNSQDWSSRESPEFRETWIKIKIPISEIQIFSKGGIH